MRNNLKIRRKTEMTFMNNEETPSRKKYLVPLVVVLLCGVAMTGAAYAYSGTLSGGSEPIDPESLVIHFSEAEEGKFKFADATPVTLNYKSKTVLTPSDDDPAKSVYTTMYALDASPENGYEFTFKVKATDNKLFYVYGTSTAKILLDGKEDTRFTATVEASTTAANEQTVKVKVTCDAEDIATKGINETAYKALSFSLYVDLVTDTDAPAED